MSSPINKETEKRKFEAWLKEKRDDVPRVYRFKEPEAALKGWLARAEEASKDSELCERKLKNVEARATDLDRQIDAIRNAIPKELRGELGEPVLNGVQQLAYANEINEADAIDARREHDEFKVYYEGVKEERDALQRLVVDYEAKLVHGEPNLSSPDLSASDLEHLREAELGVCSSAIALYKRWNAKEALSSYSSEEAKALAHHCERLLAVKKHIAEEREKTREREIEEAYSIVSKHIPPTAPGCKDIINVDELHQDLAVVMRTLGKLRTCKAPCSEEARENFQASRGD